MFTNKDKPELYELLKMNRSKLGKVPAQEKDEPSASAPVSAPSDSEPIPYTAPPSSTAKVYPKLKMPFPTLKPKEPAGVFQKPRTKPAPSKTDALRKPFLTPKNILIGGIVVAVIIIIYLLSSLPPAPPSSPGRTTPASGQEPETPPTPVATGRTWSIRLIYYNNDAEGSRAIVNMCQMLTNKNISVFTENEVINGVQSSSVYFGKYSSSEQAQKELKNELPKLIKVHYKLKNASVVKLKERR